MLLHTKVPTLFLYFYIEINNPVRAINFSLFDSSYSRNSRAFLNCMIRLISFDRQWMICLYLKRNKRRAEIFSSDTENFNFVCSNLKNKHEDDFLCKGIESLPQTLIFKSQYLCDPMSYDLRYFKL